MLWNIGSTLGDADSETYLAISLLLSIPLRPLSADRMREYNFRARSAVCPLCVQVKLWNKVCAIVVVRSESARFSFNEMRILASPSYFTINFLRILPSDGSCFWILCSQRVG